MFKQNICFFISVVETGSFSQAAKKHYISQPAISQQVAKLEDELGILLFDRSQYRPVLTEAGRYYYKNVKKLMAHYQKIEKNARNIQIKDARKIAVGITGPFENRYLPQIIEAYRETNEMQFDVRVCTFDVCRRLLESGDIDIAFGLTAEFAVNPRLEYTVIHQSELCIVCSPKNPLSRRESIRPAQIKDEPIVALSSQLGQQFYNDFINAFLLDGFEPNIVKEVNSLSEYFMAIKLNQGIGYTGREVIPAEDNLCTVKIVESHHHADFVVAYFKDNPKENVFPFYRFIVDSFEKYKKNL